MILRLFFYIYHTLVDFIFPSTPLQYKFRSITPEYFAMNARRAHNEPEKNSVFFTRESMWSYKDPLVRAAIWELKYRGDVKIANIFGKLLYDHIIETLSEETMFSNFSNPLLIPIPLSHERYKERGWNQSEMIARELKKCDKDNFFILETKILRKVRHTKPQTTLSQRERKENLKNCFVVHVSRINNKKRSIKNRNVILIDDVTTTGSTLKEAARTLKRSGARRILAFTIAH